MSEYAIRPLSAGTWDAFVQLAEKHNGVWNGCWCTWFHRACAEKGKGFEGNRAWKERLVREGKAHAALVFDGRQRGPRARLDLPRCSPGSTREWSHAR